MDGKKIIRHLRRSFIPLLLAYLAVGPYLFGTGVLEDEKIDAKQVYEETLAELKSEINLTQKEKPVFITIVTVLTAIFAGLFSCVVYLISLLGLKGQRRYLWIYLGINIIAIVIAIILFPTVGFLQNWIKWPLTAVGLILAVLSWLAGKLQPVTSLPCLPAEAAAKEGACLP